MDNELKNFDKLKAENLLKKCFSEFNKHIDDLKISDYILRKYIQKMVLLMRDSHEVMIKIYGLYTESKNYEKPKLQTLYYLIRPQIESIFNIAYLLRKPKEVELFETDSYYSFYSFNYLREKIIDCVSNSNELEFRKERAKKILLNMMSKEKRKESKERFNNIEKDINEYKYPKWKLFPTPGKILGREEIQKDIIKEALYFYYYIYKWLSSIVHVNAQLIFYRALIEKGFYNIIKNDIEEPIILSYLSIITVMSDISSFLKSPADLRGALINMWLYLIDLSYFAKYILMFGLNNCLV